MFRPSSRRSTSARGAGFRTGRSPAAGWIDLAARYRARSWAVKQVGDVPTRSSPSPARGRGVPGGGARRRDPDARAVRRTRAGEFIAAPLRRAGQAPRLGGAARAGSRASIRWRLGWLVAGLHRVQFEGAIGPRSLVRGAGRGGALGRARPHAPRPSRPVRRRARRAPPGAGRHGGLPRRAAADPPNLPPRPLGRQRPAHARRRPLRLRLRQRRPGRPVPGARAVLVEFARRDPCGPGPPRGVRGGGRPRSRRGSDGLRHADRPALATSSPRAAGAGWWPRRKTTGPTTRAGCGSSSTGR